MYTHTEKNRLGPGSIFFLVLFIAAAIGLGIMLYLDKGKFWDILPYVSIPIVVLSLILAIFNLVRRSAGRFIFIFFFIIFAISLVLSSIFGPFALKRLAEQQLESQDYDAAIDSYNKLLDDYPNSRNAPEALRKIAYAYYENHEYADALDSFSKALEQQIISWDDLEIKTIFSESHFLMAEQYLAEKRYIAAAENYIESANILKEIKTGFPDTNEAFKAEYKIPQYIMNAGQNYMKEYDYDNVINVMEEFIDRYPDQAGEFYNEATSLLLDAHIEKSILLSDNLQYKEAVTEFLKIFNIPLEKNFNITYYEKEKIFHNIPASTLNIIARDQYYSGDYIPALFLYQILIEYHPEYISEAAEYIVELKINTISGCQYNSFIQSDPGRWIDSPGTSIVFFENNTSFDMKIYLKGPSTSLIIEIPAESIHEAELEYGQYFILAELESPDTLPYFGTITYDENRQYREVFSLESEKQEGQ